MDRYIKENAFHFLFPIAESINEPEMGRPDCGTSRSGSPLERQADLTDEQLKLLPAVDAAAAASAEPIESVNVVKRRTTPMSKDRQRQLLLLILVVEENAIVVVVRNRLDEGDDCCCCCC